MGVAWDTQTHRCGRQTDGDIQGQWEMDAERDSHRLGRSGLVTVPKMVIRLQLMITSRVRDFPCGPVVKTLHFQCRVCGFHPWSWN